MDYNQPIDINTVTDANLPKIVCEYRSSIRLWDEVEIQNLDDTAKDAFQHQRTRALEPANNVLHRNGAIDSAHVCLESPSVTIQLHVIGKGAVFQVSRY